MSVERSIHGLIADIDQLARLFLQLRGVPQEVCDLFDLLKNARQRLLISAKQVANSGLSAFDDAAVVASSALKAFRSKLLDLELLLDPFQSLHQSGSRLENRHSVPWDDFDHGDYRDFCIHFKEHIFHLETDCETLEAALTRSNQEVDDKEADYQDSSPSLSSLRSFALGTGPNSRASTPASESHRRRSKPPPARLRIEDQRIFDRFVQHYSKSAPPGKRKRVGEDTLESQLVGLEQLSKQLPFPFPAQPEDLKDLELQVRKAGNFDNEDVPNWNLDDLRNALPSINSPTISPYLRSKGKQRAPGSISSAGPADYSSSSSGSIRSLPREGSIFSVSSTDRMFEDGACKIWYRQGGGMKQLDIARIDFRREAQQVGTQTVEGIVVVATTPTGQEILDPLWMPANGINSSPFLEHVEVVHAFQRHDPNANFIVRFAPNPSRHPQYSFMAREDCWDFMQSIVDKFLRASLDVESIKSAVTHGNLSESGTETLQVWEDRKTSRRSIKFFRNKNETAKLRIVELDTTCLRFPQKEKKTGKLVVELRASHEMSTKDMRYLKIVFSNADAEAGFWHETGFAGL